MFKCISTKITVGLRVGVFVISSETMIVAAMSRGTGGTTVSSLQTQAKLNWKPNQNHAENQMGDRVINVVFISVTHLFTQITKI